VPLLRPVPPPYDPQNWMKRPFAERARMVCQARALQGTPFAVVRERPVLLTTAREEPRHQYEYLDSEMVVGLALDAATGLLDADELDVCELRRQPWAAEFEPGAGAQ
jgi:hypothetical protein